MESNIELQYAEYAEYKDSQTSKHHFISLLKMMMKYNYTYMYYLLVSHVFEMVSASLHASISKGNPQASYNCDLDFFANEVYMF